MLMDDCPICQHPERESLELQVLKNKLSKRDLAEIVGCRVDEVYDHMTKHLVQMDLKDIDSKRSVLLSTLQKLSDSLDSIAQQKQYGPMTTKQLVQLGAEIRKTIMDLNVLEGNKPSEQHITIEQYNDFRSMIVAKMTKIYPKLCDKCAALYDELVESLEEEEEKDANPIVQIKK